MILTYFHSLNGWNFSPPLLIVFDFAQLQGKRVLKVGPKVQTLGPSLFHKNLNPSNSFQTKFSFATVLPLVKNTGVWAQKLPKQGHFMDVELVCKTLKTFKLAATSAILMKLITTMYRRESVNRKPLRARNLVFWRNVYEVLDYIKKRQICDVLPCIASLGKYLYEFYEKPPKIGPKRLVR